MSKGVPVKITFNARFEMPRMQLKGKSLPVMQDAASQAIETGLSRGIREAGRKIEPALYEAMNQSVWNWPNTTTRKNGSDTKAPRDIIDTQNLKNSLSVNTETGYKFSTITITYTAPYANIVHYGGITRPYGKKTGDTFVYPARPWISSMLTGSNGIKEFKVLDYVDESVNKAWKLRYSRVV